MSGVKKRAGGIIPIEKSNKKSKKTEIMDGGHLRKTVPKTDWSKLKAEKKKLRQARKQSKSCHEISVKAKKLYEQLNSKKVESVRKLGITTELFNLLSKSGCLKKFVFAHDTARIIQCLFKNSSKEIKEQIVEELSTISAEMATSKYAHFCLMRMLKLGNKSSREKIINSLYGHIIRLSSHVISSKIIDRIYLNIASPKQKTHMKQEFYGDIYKKSKDLSICKLSDVYKNADDMRTATLSAVKKNLEHVANKRLVDNSLIHSVLLEYLEESSEPERAEIVSLYTSLIPLLITTKEGCHSAILCFWYSQTKERRAIVKSLREHIEKICLHENAYLIILAITNTMDDTKAIKKVIFDQIMTSIEALMQSASGRKVIEWFISPGDTEIFHPALISFLDSGLKFSKKDKNIRRKEIFDSIEEPLCEHICGNITFWFRDCHAGLIIAAILKRMQLPYFSKVSDSIAKFIVDPEWKIRLSKSDTAGTTEISEGRFIPGIEDAGWHIALKKIIRQDKERIISNEPTFTSSVNNVLTAENILHWIKFNRACFILVNLVDNSIEFVTSHIKEILMANNNLSALKSQEHVGAKLLLEKLDLN